MVKKPAIPYLANDAPLQRNKWKTNLKLKQFTHFSKEKSMIDRRIYASYYVIFNAKHVIYTKFDEIDKHFFPFSDY